MLIIVDALFEPIGLFTGIDVLLVVIYLKVQGTSKLLFSLL